MLGIDCEMVYAKDMVGSILVLAFRFSIELSIGCSEYGRMTKMHLHGCLL